jgi:amino-acid N-acetyltransferase
MLCAACDGKTAGMSEIVIERATHADAPSIVGLLAASGLPVVGLLEHLDSVYVAKRDGRVIGTAALELYDDTALLRSVAVDVAERGTGIGRVLTDAAIADAHARGVGSLYLLTTTADRYFPRFGFAVVPREEVPASVRESIEFRSACPASATVMRKPLGDA